MGMQECKKMFLSELLRRLKLEKFYDASQMEMSWLRKRLHLISPFQGYPIIFGISTIFYGFNLGSVRTYLTIGTIFPGHI